ncbi:MAG: hypothetical protein ACI4NL_00605 [Christensenellales bacterium]
MDDKTLDTTVIPDQIPDVPEAPETTEKPEANEVPKRGEDTKPPEKVIHTNCIGCKLRDPVTPSEYRCKAKKPDMQTFTCYK